MIFKNSVEFFDYCQKIFLEKMERQYPDLEQGSLMYEIINQVCSKLKSGQDFLKPNTFEYYGLNDADVFFRKKDDRNQFIADMNIADNILEFISLNSRSYINVKDGLFWRRIPVWEEKYKNWRINNNLDKKENE